MRTLVLLLSVILIGCSGDTSDKNGTPGDDDDDDDTLTTDTGGDTGGGEPEGIDIVAVGFEVLGILEPDGSFGPFLVDGVEYPPQVIVTFTDLAYFDLASDQQAGHYCTVNGFFGLSDYTVFDVVPPSTSPLLTRSQAVIQGENNGDFDNALLSSWYDVALLLDTEGHDCGGLVDGELWGEDAEVLIDSFNGAHFAWGFGLVTEYIRAGWSQETLDEYGDSMTATYLAINDRNGDFFAYDWSSSLLWEVDPDTNEILYNGDQTEYLAPVSVAGLPAGAALPEAYVQSYAFWYQDFAPSSGSVGLDLTNLKNGAP